MRLLKLIVRLREVFSYNYQYKSKLWAIFWGDFLCVWLFFVFLKNPFDHLSSRTAQDDGTASLSTMSSWNC